MVVFRYTHTPGEEFFSLAWTVLDATAILACGGMLGGIVLLNDTLGTAYMELRNPTGGGIFSLAFCPGRARLLVSGSDDGTVRIWDIGDVAGRGAGSLALLTGHRGAVNCVAWSPSGLRLLSTSDDRTLRLWQTPFAALSRALDETEPPSSTARIARAERVCTEDNFHSSNIDCAAFVGEDLVASKASADGDILLWSHDPSRRLTEEQFARAHPSLEGEDLATAYNEQHVVATLTIPSEEQLFIKFGVGARAIAHCDTSGRILLFDILEAFKEISDEPDG